MATFSELQTAISKRLLDPNNTAVSSLDVQDAINNAVKFWKNERFWFNEKESTFALNTGSNTVSNFPTDLLFELPSSGFIINYGQVNWHVEKVGNDTYDAEFTDSGTGLPYIITQIAGVWKVYFAPDQAYNMTVKYIKDYDALVNGDDTNDFTINANKLIEYDALSRLHGELRQDPKMESYYSARSQNELDNLTKRTRKYIGTGELEIDNILTD